MKSIVFDTGPIISLAINNLLEILEPLKRRFNGEFYIPEKVEIELIKKPLSTKIYKFEALRVLRIIRKNTLKIVSGKHIDNLTNQLLSLANNLFVAHGHSINIVHAGEMQALATAILLNSKALAVDERTTRILIENPKTLEDILKNKLHTNIKVNKKNLKKFKELTEGIGVIRSIELIVVAFKIGLLDKYIAKEGKKQLLDALLWGLKLNGCAVSKNEIERIKKLEL